MVAAILTGVEVTKHGVHFKDFGLRSATITELRSSTASSLFAIGDDIGNTPPQGLKRILVGLGNQVGNVGTQPACVCNTHHGMGLGRLTRRVDVVGNNRNPQGRCLDIILPFPACITLVGGLWATASIARVTLLVRIERR